MRDILVNKKFAAALSVTSNTSLIIVKFIAGFLSGSISIISEAIHSCSDLLASVITVFSVNKSEKPADNDHQFGHGKYEDFSGLLEGALIILAAFYIIYEAGKKLALGVTPMSHPELAMGVMFISVIVNLLISSYLFLVAKKTDSMALFADAEHLRTDIYSSLAVFFGLIAMKLTGMHVLDPMIAILVAAIIINAGWKICKQSTNNLLDGALPQEDIEKIKYTISKYEDVKEIKTIKTRKAGKDKDIVVTIFVDGRKTIAFAHKLCDKLESALEDELGNTTVTIHIEPLSSEKSDMPLNNSSLPVE